MERLITKVCAQRYVAMEMSIFTMHVTMEIMFPVMDAISGVMWKGDLHVVEVAILLLYLTIAQRFVEMELILEISNVMMATLAMGMGALQLVLLNQVGTAVMVVRIKLIFAGLCIVQLSLEVLSLQTIKLYWFCSILLCLLIVTYIFVNFSYSFYDYE